MHTRSIHILITNEDRGHWPAIFAMPTEAVHDNTHLEDHHRTCIYIMSTYPDQTPVPGYTSPNSNSLLDWGTGGLQQMV